MNENRIPNYLDHMFEAARQACSYTEGLCKKDFIADKRTQINKKTIANNTVSTCFSNFFYNIPELLSLGKIVFLIE